jgi:hypothetical protein
MAIYHCVTKPLSRSTGRSAVATAAYHAGACLRDGRQGIQHDYTRRSDVVHADLVVPEGAEPGQEGSVERCGETR